MLTRAASVASWVLLAIAMLSCGSCVNPTEARAHAGAHVVPSQASDPASSAEQLHPARRWVVNQSNPNASDTGEGTAGAPFLTISAAAARARAGDWVVVGDGVYRERVAPMRGGSQGNPITYAAAAGAHPVIRGSMAVAPTLWEPLATPPPCASSTSNAPAPAPAPARAEHATPPAPAPAPAPCTVTHGTVFRLRLEAEWFETINGGVFNPFAIRLGWPGNESVLPPFGGCCKLGWSLGQVFQDGKRLQEVPPVTVNSTHPLPPNSWTTVGNGSAVLARFGVSSSSGSPLHTAAAGTGPVGTEITVRKNVFAPHSRGLGWITVRGFVMEHAATQVRTAERPLPGHTAKNVAAWAWHGALKARANDLAAAVKIPVTATLQIRFARVVCARTKWDDVFKIRVLTFC